MAEGDKKMKGRLKALYLGGSLALSVFMIKPAMADDWNKRIDFQFSAPVEIPGKVLMPGKYVFELLDSDSDRNIVEVFSEDSSGKQTPVTIIQAVPAYIENISDKPVIHLEERVSGAPEAVHSWFYPGEHTGWEFVYSKENGLATTADTTPAPAPAATAATPVPATTAAALSPSPTPQVQERAAAPQVSITREEILVAQNDAPAQPPALDTNTQSDVGVSLPETAGYSDAGLLTGLAMLGGGMAVLFVSRRKSQA
jgi:hypothetical protein